MDEELKPCPFCGKPGTVFGGWFGCSNRDCLVEAGRYGDGGHEAIPAWNTRPIEDALNAELAQQNELRRMEAEALAGVNKEVERRLRARIAALETALRGATHEVLFDPTGPRHVMAIDMADYHAALAALEQA